MNDSEVTMNSLTIRMALPSDAAALERLAELDSAGTPHDPVLVAEVSDELWAAISLDDFKLVGDPFRPSGEVQFLLLERARQLRDGGRHPGVLGRVFASVTGHAPRPAARLVH
ncbi:MAG TPA: hypothetical protein VH418_04080 [Solirubrobacteraceae bacterium]|jgi:hypothetical protein